MEIKDKLDKPYTEKQKCDFIVKNNHWLGYEIEETDEALLAIYNEPLPPTEEEQRENRARVYQAEVDPITSHIQRLRDEEQTEEIITKINELIEERSQKVLEIQERFPYPVKDEGEL
jgi:DNA-directed RNA polymerase specialized sigma subunit